MITIRAQCLQDPDDTECRVIAELGVKPRRKHEFVQALSAAELVLMLMVGKEHSRRALFMIYRVMAQNSRRSEYLPAHIQLWAKK